MGFLASGVFWGCVLVLWGLSIIIETVFHVHIPFFRIVVALVIIFFGLRLLTGGGMRMKSDHSAIFTEATFAGPDVRTDYHVVFGEGTVDLSRSPAGKVPDVVTVNAVFGSATVKLDGKMGVRVTANTAFGHVQLPDRSTAAFGGAQWASKSAKPGSPEIRVNAVFGEVTVTAD